MAGFLISTRIITSEVVIWCNPTISIRSYEQDAAVGGMWNDLVVNPGGELWNYQPSTGWMWYYTATGRHLTVVNYLRWRTGGVGILPTRRVDERRRAFWQICFLHGHTASTQSFTAHMCHLHMAHWKQNNTVFTSWSSGFLFQWFWIQIPSTPRTQQSKTRQITQEMR